MGRFMTLQCSLYNSGKGVSPFEQTYLQWLVKVNQSNHTLMWKYSNPDTLVLARLFFPWKTDTTEHKNDRVVYLVSDTPVKIVAD